MLMTFAWESHNRSSLSAQPPPNLSRKKMAAHSPCIDASETNPCATSFNPIATRSPDDYAYWLASLVPVAQRMVAFQSLADTYGTVRARSIEHAAWLRAIRRFHRWIAKLCQGNASRWNPLWTDNLLRNHYPQEIQRITDHLANNPDTDTTHWSTLTDEQLRHLSGVQQQLQIEAKHEADRAAVLAEEPVSDVKIGLRCFKCGSQKVSFVSVQRRRCDEPPTTSIQCQEPSCRAERKMS